jgi:hypothetical protein
MDITKLREKKKKKKTPEAPDKAIGRDKRERESPGKTRSDIEKKDQLFVSQKEGL